MAYTIAMAEETVRQQIALAREAAQRRADAARLQEEQRSAVQRAAQMASLQGAIEEQLGATFRLIHAGLALAGASRYEADDTDAWLAFSVGGVAFRLYCEDAGRRLWKLEAQGYGEFTFIGSGDAQDGPLSERILIAIGDALDATEGSS